MNTAARVLCILPKFHHITDLLMNLQWLSVYQRILLEVLYFKLITYQAYFLYRNSRDLRSNYKLLINPDNA